MNLKPIRAFTVFFSLTLILANCGESTKFSTTPNGESSTAGETLNGGATTSGGTTTTGGGTTAGEGSTAGTGSTGGEPGTTGGTPTPSPTPTDVSDPTPSPKLRCQFDSVVLNPGQSTTVKWILDNPPNVMPASILPYYQYRLDSPKAESVSGSIHPGLELEVLYQAPLVVADAFEVKIIAESTFTTPIGQYSAACTVRLNKGADIGPIDDGKTRGLVGNVYRLQKDTQFLPNFDLLEPESTIVVSNLDIPIRSFTEGFPGVSDLFEDFGIRFRGQIIVPEEKNYSFRVSSDDGSKLYIDGKRVIDNDGTHYVASKDGNIELTAGSHIIEVQYFQGPRDHIALQLFWKNAQNQFVIIPPDNFRRPE